MTLDSFDHKIKELIASIEQKTKHIYIEKYIEKPVIDKVKLALLMNIFKQSSLTKSDQKKYLVSAMLIQIASDIHELVPATNEITKETSEKEKQLLVLAGDYYSGLHYLYLADTGNYTMLRTLASAVREVNELKMDLYYTQDFHFDEILYYQKKIHSIVTIRILELFTDFTVQPYIADLIIVYQLLADRQLLFQHNQTRLFTKIYHNLPKQSLISEIDETINHHVKCLEKQMLDPLTMPTIQLLKFDQLFERFVANHCSLVEEG